MKKRFIRLTQKEKEKLEYAYRRGKGAHYRNRCRAILLSDKGYDIDSLVEIFGTTRQTIYRWFNRYEKAHLEGLKNQGTRGRHAKLDIHNEKTVKLVKRLIENEPRNLNKVLAELEQQLGIELSRRTLNRFLKKLVFDGSDFVKR